VDIEAIQQLAVSFGLGLLLGLERERSESSIAGIRTFPFISLLGTICAQISVAAGGWIIGAGLAALAVILVTANLAKLRAGEIDPGITTEVAALLLYALGALIVVGDLTVAVVIGGVMAVLLHLKQPLHTFAKEIGKNDMHAIMQFVILTLIILPVLPNKKYGPYEVWNPFKIWLMVVLIVGLSLGGYVAFKYLGARAGTLLGGILGGLISSTAATFSFARRAASETSLAPLAALVIMIAACVSLARVLVEIAAVASGSFPDLAPPLAVLLAVCCIIAGAMYLLSRKQQHVRMSEQKNPAEIKSAVIFGAVYALVLLAVAAAKERFGEAGLYVVAAISGLTDMDAITLSVAGQTGSGSIDAKSGWRFIMVAALANFVFKFGIVATLAPRELTARVAAAFGCAVGAGAAILVLWR
jgi:uncharacterized membrane protein (DUF4010 family)